MVAELNKLTKDKRESFKRVVADDFKNGGKIFGSHFVKEIPLSRYMEGIEQQAALASEGRILINCQ